MSRVIVNTQKEWDELPETFEKYTKIEISAIEPIRIYKNKKNSYINIIFNKQHELIKDERKCSLKKYYVVLYNDVIATVKGGDVICNDNVTLYAYKMIRIPNIIEAYDNSNIVAHGNSYIQIHDEVEVISYGENVFWLDKKSKPPKNYKDIFGNKPLTFEEKLEIKLLEIENLSTFLVKTKTFGNVTLYKGITGLYVLKVGDIMVHSYHLKWAFKYLRKALKK